MWAGLEAGGVCEHDRSTWPAVGGHAKVEMPAPFSPTPGELPQFKALMLQLGGGHFNGGGAQIAPIFPNTRKEDWKLPNNGHIDGYNGIWSGTGANRVSATFYLNDVEEQGGCFTYWPGGANRFHQFLQNQPEQVDGRFTRTAEYNGDSHPYKGGDGREAYVGVQHAAKAGTVCLWHGWTPHQASANSNDVPRLCIISRWWVVSLAATHFACCPVSKTLCHRTNAGMTRDLQYRRSSLDSVQMSTVAGTV
eukprot:COSAG02_NODE_1173_length_14105_cov_15.197701_10_plen_250_part_00